MDLSLESLKIILNNSRVPSAIFNLKQELFCSNDTFNQYYYLNTQDKILTTRDASLTESSNENTNKIDLQQLLSGEVGEKNIFFDYLSLQITPLYNKKNQHYLWLLVLRQSYVAYDFQFIPHDELRNRFQLLIENIPQIVWITDSTGLVEYCNQRWEEYSGLDFNQTLAGDWAAAIHPDDLPLCLDAWQRSLDSKCTYEVKIRFKRVSDGAYRWHLSRSFPIYDTEGNVKNWYGTCTDIHDVHNAQQSLLKEQQRYNTLVQSLQTVYWTTDAIGAVIEPQPVWEIFTGQSHDEVKGFGWMNAVHPDDHEHTTEKWNDAVKHPKIYENMLRIWSKKDNEYVYCIARAAPYLDEEGNVIKWIGSCLDINAQKISEVKMQEMSEHLTLALEVANAGAWSFDPKLDKVKISENMYKLFGIQVNSVNKFSDFCHLVNPEDLDAIRAEVKEVLENKKPRLQCEYRVKREDGAVRTFLSKAKLYVKNDVVKLMGASFDVTERIQLEQLVRQMQLDFDKESRAISVAEIVSLLAHEINQPLAAISTFAQGCIQKIEQGNGDKSDILYGLNELILQSERMGNIIHRIKNSVSKKYLYVESSDFKEIVNESIKFIRYEKSNNHIHIHHESVCKSPAMLIDKVQIQQVLVNLLRNSIEAFAGVNCGDPKIHISYEVRNGKNLLFQLYDNGTGFPAEVLNQNAFVISTKHEGMGMGLRICRTIIEAHGGRLILNNLPQGGAQVQFTIPIVAE